MILNYTILFIKHKAQLWYITQFLPSRNNPVVTTPKRHEYVKMQEQPPTPCYAAKRKVKPRTGKSNGITTLAAPSSAHQPALSQSFRCLLDHLCILDTLRTLVTGALISLRSLTPSTICFIGVPWPAAMLLARPRRSRIAARAASRSMPSLFNDNSPKTGVCASAAAWATVEGVIGPRPALKAGVAGEKCRGMVVVVVMVRVR